MERREFTKVMGAVVAGMAAGSKVFGFDDAKKASPAPAAELHEPHVCKGLNTCSGKGGCKAGDKGCAGKNSCKTKGGCASAAAKHECAAKNNCKYMGGCKAGDAGCAGKNSCKTKGGCKVPLDATHAEKKDKAACKGKGGCSGR